MQSENAMERRKCMLEHARKANPLLNQLFEHTPRDFGMDVIFCGSGRASVRATASVWANNEFASNEVKHPRVHVGGQILKMETPANVTMSPNCIEVDLDASTSMESKSIMQWLLSKVQTRHVMHNKHVVLIHSAERAYRGHLARLHRNNTVILIASTTNLTSLASLSGLVQFRVPCEAITSNSDIPDDVLRLFQPLSPKFVTVQAVREAVFSLLRIGLNIGEICQIAWIVTGKSCFADATVADRVFAFANISHLSHAANGVSQFDRRALECILLIYSLGPMNAFQCRQS